MKQIEIDENVQKQGQVNIFVNFNKLRCGVIRYNALPAHTMFLLIFLILFIILNISIYIAGEVKPGDGEKIKYRFVLDKDKTRSKNTAIRLLDSKGKEIRKIELIYEEKENEDGVKEFKALDGEISDDGQYAAIISIEGASLEIHIDATAKLKYIDVNNKVLWEKQDIYPYETHIQISQDGSRIAFMQIINSVGRIVVCDKDGKELFKKEFHRDIYGIFLTKNGKFGYMRGDIKVAKGFGLGFTFFNVDSGETHIIDDSLAPNGWTELTEDGEVIAEIDVKLDKDGNVRGTLTQIYKFK